MATERTSAGEQYVIPGCERPTRKARPTYGRDGEQLVIPGAERLPASEIMRRLAAAPLQPRKGQKSIAGTGLFSKGRKGSKG